MVEIVETRSRPSTALSDVGDLLLVPQAPPPRKVGPGRLERGYQRRIELLERLAKAAGEQQRELELQAQHAAGELAVAARLERGLQRLADRQEQRLDLAAQREKRLALALGAVQRENELLRARLELGGGTAPAQLGTGPRARSARPARRGLWARLLGRS